MIVTTVVRHSPASKCLTSSGEVQDHLQEVTEVVGRGYLGFAATLADGRNITWPLTKRERPRIREMPPKVPEELKEKLRCTDLGGGILLR